MTGHFNLVVVIDEPIRYELIRIRPECWISVQVPQKRHNHRVLGNGPIQQLCLTNGSMWHTNWYHWPEPLNL